MFTQILKPAATDRRKWFGGGFPAIGGDFSTTDWFTDLFDKGFLKNSKNNELFLSNSHNYSNKQLKSEKIVRRCS